MSARALSLPIRAFSRPQIAQQAERYTCRRCLHGTQAQAQEATSVQQTDAQTHLTPAPLGLLKRVLPHSIRPQLLQHVDPERLHGREREAALNAQKHAEIVGVVVRTGRMEKTVSVRVPKQRWEPRIKKYFADHENHLVHDPNNSLNQGDVIKMHRLKVSTAVHHVVASIVTPFGTPIESRPPIPTPEERLAAYKAKRLPQLQRRSLRRKAAEGSAEAIAELKRQGLDPGAGAVPGKGETSGTEKGAGKVRNPKEGALMGKKGQKLPKGVLPGGKHEVGKIDARAKHNKEAALKMQGQAKANLKRAQ